MGSLTHEELVSIRRDFHQHPELRFAENRTSLKIGEILEAQGWDVKRDSESPGLLVTWPTRSTKAHILIRADIDAYPVQDGKSVPYASQTPGVTHACGHDVHTTAAIGAASRIAANPSVRTEVSFLFQPAEEIPYGEPSGARRMLDSGLLDQSYAAIIGLHCWPHLEAGTIGVDSGAAMAAKDAFGIEFHGLSTHAATPELARDALLAASDAIVSLHAAVSRSRSPHDLVAFNVGTITGGQSQSAVPDFVSMTGTLRTHDEAVRLRMKSVIERVTQGSAEKFDVTAKLTWANQMPAVINSPGLTQLAFDTLPATNHRVLRLTEPPLTTDDFSLLAERGPTLYFKLGVSPAGATTVSPLHTAQFDVDETSIGVAVDALESLIHGAVAARDEGVSLA